MFGEFLNIIFKSIKLDKTLYSDNKNFGEASIYFAGLIMIFDGIAGAVAANTVIKTAVAMSGLTAIITWFIWAIFIYVVGVKLFSDKESKVTFKKILVAVGGVFDVDSYNEKIDMGADLVQMYTGLVFEGPNQVRRIVKNGR